jgi:hypothetical protein
VVAVLREKANIDISVRIVRVTTGYRNESAKVFYNVSFETENLRSAARNGENGMEEVPLQVHGVSIA